MTNNNFETVQLWICCKGNLNVQPERSGPVYQHGAAIQVVEALCGCGHAWTLHLDDVLQMSLSMWTVRGAGNRTPGKASRKGQLRGRNKNKRKRVITRSEGFAVAKTSNAKPSCTVIAMRLSTSLQTSADCTVGKLRFESPQWMQYSKRPRLERSN